MRRPSLALVTCCSLLLAAPAAAGTSSFLFVGAPRELPARRVAVSLESGYEHRGIRNPFEDAAAHRFGLRVPFGARFEAVGRIEAGGGARSETVSGEILARWTAGRSSEHGRLFSLAVGGRQESIAVTTLLASAAGSIPVGRSRLAASVDLERPMSEGRDAIDVLTSAGWMKPFGARFEAGLEVSGQDLEGFWAEEEAEGGASFFVGPTLSVRSLGAPFGLSVAGGPVFHATSSPNVSGAPRPFPSGRNGYALRLALRIGEAD